jgi:hypothetical protein
MMRKVAQGAEAASQAFGQLQQTVDSFNGSIGEAGFEESQYAVPMRALAIPNCRPPDATGYQSLLREKSRSRL